MGQHYFPSDDESMVYKVRIRKNADQSIPDVTNTFLTWETVIFDQWSMYDSGDNTKLTIPADGHYMILTSIVWNNSSSGARIVVLLKNGTTAIGSNTVPSISGFKEEMSAFAMDKFSKDDYLQVRVYHNHGSALSVKLYSNVHFAIFQIR